MKNKTPEVAYRYWQDRATPFYLAARILYTNERTPEVSAFCAYQAIENIIKAALRFHGDQTEGHIFGKVNLVEQVKEYGVETEVPSYFEDFQAVTRYPESGKNNSRGSGLCIPKTFLDDLDQIIFEVISQIPDKEATRLKDYLTKKSERILELSKDNKYFLKLKSFYLKK